MVVRVDAVGERALVKYVETERKRVSSGRLLRRLGFSSTSARKASIVKNSTIGGLFGTMARVGEIAGMSRRSRNQGELWYLAGTRATSRRCSSASSPASSGGSTELGSS